MAFSRAWRTRYLFYASLVLITPFLLSVLNLHRDPIPANPKPKPLKKSKSDHLVLGPAAGQGLPSRLQCQGLKAVNMDESLRLREKTSVGDAVSFVTVFTVYNSSQRSESSGFVTVGNVSYSKEERSLAILNTFIDFIQVSMPRSSVIILTDPASDFSVNRNTATVLPIEGDYSRGQLMLQRIRSYMVVHFKGSRKRLMLESWNFFNSTSNLPDMLCLVLKSGRTKYDF